MRKLKRLLFILKKSIYNTSHEPGLIGMIIAMCTNLFLMLYINKLFIYDFIYALLFMIHLTYFVFRIFIPNWKKCAYEYDIGLLNEII
jgi:hypothetical protein